MLLLSDGLQYCTSLLCYRRRTKWRGSRATRIPSLFRFFFFEAVAVWECLLPLEWAILCTVYCVLQYCSVNSLGGNEGGKAGKGSKGVELLTLMAQNAAAVTNTRQASKQTGKQARKRENLGMIQDQYRYCSAETRNSKPPGMDGGPKILNSHITPIRGQRRKGILE
ncbi:hypothetical protein HOY80DRAFT_442040 [Tuber brumale]|nr:hypothetical protein HOY80DRAFT_442040 [Tuber brumale]